MTDNVENPGLGGIEPNPVGAAKLIRASRCENCAFAASLEKDMRFECHAGPPSLTSFLGPVPGGQVQVMTSTNFPLVQPTNWCGMHKPKLAIHS